MGATVAPKQFPAPGATPLGALGNNVVTQANQQPGTALKKFNPASVAAAAPTPAPTPAPAAYTAAPDSTQNWKYAEEFYGPQYQGW